VERPPEQGWYITDGRRLAEVIGVDVDGKFHLCDCREDCDAMSDDHIILPLPEVLKWELVRA
jgi:hypothetical protein